MRFAPNGNLALWIKNQFPDGYRGWCIDVGASDGVSINTTYHLEKVHRWTVVSVEPNPFFHAMLKRERMMVECCALSSEPQASAVLHVNQENPEAYSALVKPNREEARGLPWDKVEVPVRTLNQVLDKWDFPRLDALCIDTEGTELDVLKGCDLERWKPKVVVVESWDDVSDADRYLAERGWVRKARNVHNNIHVRED